MLTNTKAFSGFAVDDLQKAREFYGETLGLKTSVLDQEHGLMSLHLAGDRDTLVYQKPDHAPATYTILNFEVDDIDKPAKCGRVRAPSRQFRPHFAFRLTPGVGGKGCVPWTEVAILLKSSGRLPERSPLIPQLDHL